MNSIQNSSTPAAAHVKKPAGIGLSPKTGKEATEAAGEFAGLFAAMMGGSPGQQVADPDGKASPQPLQLAAEALSPTVNIITTSKPATNDDSLLAFAKAQGLDDAAMAMIFQDRPAGAALPPEAAAVPAGAAAVPAGAVTASAETASIKAAATMSAMLDLGAEATMRWSLGQSAATEPPATETQPVLPPQVTSELLKPFMFGLNGVRTSAAAATTAAQAAEGNGEETENPSFAASLMLGEADAFQFAKKLQAKELQTKFTAAAQQAESNKSSASLESASGITEASLSDSVQTAPESLILGADLTGDDLQAILSQRADNIAKNQSQQGDSPAALASQTDMDQRTEQYEKLSQRLAEALGQRLSAQIARGEWKVELALKPHNLGTIDIRLNMKQGELEASFQASNQATRDLIADGLPRLKEALAQSGMEVAQFDVNARQSSQNGGNPTPGRQQSSGASASSVLSNDAKATTAPGPVATGKQRAGSDGLDLLV
jgi:flagellar hook-length control protein FliK